MSGSFWMQAIPRVEHNLGQGSFLQLRTILEKELSCEPSAANIPQQEG